MPLVLGGTEAMRFQIFVDSSHATGPHYRGINGIVTKAAMSSGAIYGKASAKNINTQSSMETELEGKTTAFKEANKNNTISKELGVRMTDIPAIWNDNEASINFVKGVNNVKGVRHMKMREWYTKEEYLMGTAQLEHMAGDDERFVADGCTKVLGSISLTRKHAKSIMGLGLLGYDYYERKGL